MASRLLPLSSPSRIPLQPRTADPARQKPCPPTPRSCIPLEPERTNLCRAELDSTGWGVYGVRRLYRAAKDKNGKAQSDKKGTAIRAVERLSEAIPRASAMERLRELAHPTDEISEQRGITYAYRRRCGTVYPTREEFLVAAPAAVRTKARYGIEWFERQWDEPQRSLFEDDATEATRGDEAE